MRSQALFLASLWATATCIDLRKIELDILVSSRQALILFTADGCNECSRVQLELDKTSLKLPTLPIASVNCQKEPEACDESKVFSVPTLKFTTGNGQLVTYKEGFNSSSIIRYIERQSGSPVKLLTQDSYLNFRTSSPVTVVAFFSSSASEEDRDAFKSVAKRWRTQYSFGSVDVDEASASSSIIVHVGYNDDAVTYQERFNADDIEAFLREATTPLIQDFDPEVYEEIIKAGKPIAQVFFSPLADKAELIKSLVPLAKKYKDQMSFATVLSSDYPSRESRPYPMNLTTTDFEADTIAGHIEAYLNGALKPTIKSEAVPEPSKLQPFLTTLVGSTFDEFVFDTSRDILVQFQIQWCKYCKGLNEQMNRLGSKYVEAGLSDKVAVATVDVEANDVPIRIDSYPSIRLYRAKTNEVVSFQGDFNKMLTVQELDWFVSTEGDHGVSVMPQDTNVARSRDEL
ncbi:disulfide-isomerase precursor [Fusarium beomiforme]|uniref:Disulfide-isomerase n=1 Tax=Fusarium beomiforme TaxID=44412 RepID=A0A9P5ALI1_9HYPO|nr:disulfide-isomerase precursor [Fusarium beomiforme]